jgi:hypothetical protein
MESSLLLSPAQENEKTTLQPTATSTGLASPIEAERNRLQGNEQRHAITDRQVYKTYAKSMGL